MSHYFIEDKNLEHKRSSKEVTIKNYKFKLTTDSGVFSKNGLDFGTRSLLESLNEEIHGDVLDLGCGYGPIGIYLKSVYNCDVDMIDINNRSLDLARENAKQNNVDVNIFYSDAYDAITKKYDYIITNPPIRVGKQIMYKILFGAKAHLKENGKLFLVINKDHGAKSLVRDLEKEFKVNIINKNKGFFIICAHL